MKKILIIIILIFPIYLFGQTITGTVLEKINDEEIPIPGVNVYWINTTIGTATDEDGKFKLERPSNQHKELVISYVGYDNDTISIEKKQKDIEIILSMNKELQAFEVVSRAPGAHISRLEPMTVIEITGAELCKAACCNLGESFETNASVDVHYSDAVTGAKQIQLLGLSGTYTQLMTENVPNLYGLAQPYGLSYIPGTWMKSISISKGSAAVLDGYSSLAGQINTQTKDPDVDERLIINGLINSMLKYEGNVVARFKISDKLSTNILLHAENRSTAHDNNGDGFIDDPMITQFNVMNKWKYRINEGSMLMLGIKGLYEDRRGGQMEYYNAENKSDLYGIDIKTKRIEGLLKGGHEFANNNFNIALKSTASYHVQNSFFGLNTYDAKQTSVYVNTVLQGVFAGNPEHSFSTGLSFAYDKYDESLHINTVDNAPKPEFEGISLNDTMNMITKEIVPGAYFQYTFNKENYPTIIAGIRGDYHNEYGFFVTPRLHLRYKINDKNIIRASAGMGYKTPRIISENTYLLASSKQIFILGDLSMERAWNYGINYTRYFTINDRELVLNAEVYRSDFINQIITDMDQDYRFVYFYNLDGKSYSNVFQIEANYELIRGLDVVLAFRYQDVKVTELEKGLQRKPMVNRYKGLINLSYGTRMDKWRFDFTTQFNGDQRLPVPDYSISGNIPEWADDLTDKSPMYVILNAQVTKNFRNWSVYLGGENLTNYKQKNPIIGADNPFSEYFDSSRVWGPIHGILVYVGFRVNLD